MKKILSIALVALLATSAVFAGFTGSASVGFGYDLDSKDFGFTNSSSTEIDIKATYATGAYPVPAEATEEAAEAEEAEEVAAPSIYAGIDAAFTITAEASNEGVTFKVDPNEVSEAYVAGENWKVSILGAADAPDFAKSSLDKYYDEDADKNLASDVKLDGVKAPGIKLTYNGWTIAGGIAGSTAETKVANFTNSALKGYVAEYTYWYFKGKFDPATTVVVKSKDNYTAEEWKDYAKKNKLTAVKNEIANYVELDKDGKRTGNSKSVEAYEDAYYSYSYPVEYKKLDYSVYFATPELAFGPVKVNAAAFLSDVSKAADDEVAPGAYLGLSDAGVSLNAAYEDSFIKASVASDFVFGNIGAEKVDFNYDVAAKASFAPVYVIPEVEEGEEPADPKLDHYIGAFEAYYAKSAKAETILATNTKLKNAPVVENLLSAKASAKLDSFVGLPLTVAVTGRDILNAKVYGMDVAATVGNVTAGLKAEYGFVNKDYAFSGNVAYANDIFTAKASAVYKSGKQLYASASLESAAIIPGATLKLAYAPTSDEGLVTTNLLEKVDGKIDATCTIAF